MIYRITCTVRGNRVDYEMDNFDLDCCLSDVCTSTELLDLCNTYFSENEYSLESFNRSELLEALFEMRLNEIEEYMEDLVEDFIYGGHARPGFLLGD